MTSKKGFTFVEIMVVVGIVCLLAAIAIPNLLRAKLSANEALAKSTVRTIYTAAESYRIANNGNYPLAMSDLTGITPPYLSVDYCTDSPPIYGYKYTCSFSASTFTVVASPVRSGFTGNVTYTVTTGGALTQSP